MPFSTTPIQEQHGLRFACTTLLLSWLTAFGPLCTDMYLPTLPDIAADLSISTALAQSSITSCLLGLALGQLFVGPISDSRGRHGVLVLSLVLYTVASFLCTQAEDGTSFIVLRFLQGFGGAGGAVLARAVCCDIFHGSKLTQYISLLMAIHSVAPILGPVVGGFLGGWAGWRSVFWVLAGIGVILTLSTLFFLPETLAKDKRVQGGVLASLANTGRLFRERAYLCYTCVQGFTMGGFFAYVSASPFVFQNVYGLSMERFSLIFAVNAIGMVCTSLLAGWLSKRLGDKRLLLAGDMARTLACGAVFYVCLVTPASPWPLMIALFAMLAMQSFTLSPSFSLAICSQSVGAGAASGILGVAVFLFGALTSPLTGLAGPQSALPLGIIVLVTGLCSLCSSILGNRLYETKLVP
ncbi:hypothetical protein B5F76_03650 [Desulfovibrio sp. An276]|uniref:multidrug effflux MFS transporter n=1 Tax=Desulfovibrio sp. An276 TaxID=1965618 RepID=UPI000B38BC53|nr:multidrug effflux MFS transporter [Desulfovibrio sp. An276]OUO54208.1 hypothetical protein B5F76_03650 [Desulfovibrio sp. An276]